ncbi:glycoside hydrolase family 13 protein [Cyanobium sp. CH-040]|uniref:glycoside hydrolase family 13 protein n=1 Tax=Cyanobium sp. CH-040 TaxID=2823708 RepID=UPI0020CC403B|nr:glycoside hydrolase family 13 protein [Cyanobium sp. CH-040]MCP9926683.1 glycoside hydrolase family 13 protein [Cyanobium sp. CH-040]
MEPATPAWVADAVVLQVFPDRFRRSGRVEAQQDLELLPWGSPPERQGFQGGDLLGVIDALDRIEALGVNTLSLNPVFASAAYHRYHTFEYFQVDPLLGGNGALAALIEAVHERGMRLILDGVFNHCGRGFWAFHHLLENGEASPYRHWFHVERWPLNPYPAPGESCGYHCWWNDPALPRFNHAHPGVRRYLLAVARHWLAAGIDGWRLDVADEVPTDFWRAFRETVRAERPDAWIVGEIWRDGRPWLGEPPLFDGVMNYPLAWPILGYFGAASLRSELVLPALGSPPYQPLDRAGFERRVEEVLGWYPAATRLAQLNLLDGHDTPRALHVLQGDTQALQLCLLCLFLLPGAPCLYYGTELELAGGPEPGCREAYPWERSPGPLAAWITRLSALRREQPALRSAALRFLPSPHDDVVVLERGEGPQRLWVAINRGERELVVAPPAGIGGRVWPAGEQPERGIPPKAVGADGAGPLRLPGRSALILSLPRGDGTAEPADS